MTYSEFLKKSYEEHFVHLGKMAEDMDNFNKLVNNKHISKKEFRKHMKILVKDIDNLSQNISDRGIELYQKS